MLRPYKFNGVPMKTLCLFILTLVALYNPKVEANSSEIDPTLVENYNYQLFEIKILKKDPIENIEENLLNFNKLIVLYKDFQNYDTELASDILIKILRHIMTVCYFIFAL